MEFSLNFTKSVPHHYLPNYRQATSAYTQTLKNPPLNIGFRQKRKGEYIITAYNDKDAKKLKDVKVRYDYGPNDKYSSSIKIDQLPTYEFRTDPKYIYIDWTEDSGLRFARNEDFDRWLEKYVSVITPTAADKDRDTGFANGRRKAHVDFDKGVHIPRFENLEFDVVLPSGEKKLAKGKVKITYRDQPVSCRACNGTHSGKCPAREKEDTEREAAELKRAPLIKTLMIGDSNLRHVNQQGTSAKVNSSTGAKIGHTANALAFEELEQFDHLVIHSGQNNINVEPVVFAQWENQLNAEVTQLHQLLQTYNGNTKLIAVPESDISTKNDQTKKMRQTINTKLKDVSRMLTSGQFIEVNDDLGDGEEAWSDFRHYSEVMCGKVLESVDATYQDGEKLLLRNEKATTARKYARVNASYRLGCGQCTLLGHLEASCTKLTGTKRQNVSGSTSPPPNKK